MFYKFDGELISSSFVSGPNFDLVDNDHENYTYPVEGWYWFDSEQEAKTFFNVFDEINSNLDMG